MIDSMLNRRILDLAPQFEAKDVAPDTFSSLASCVSAGRLVVWAGASEHTIYGDPNVNHAFRAWHDSLHLALNAPFTLDGEKFVAMEQARIIGDGMARILLAEVVGQAEYFDLHGTFPTDQTLFIIEYLKRGKL